jgi:hypothetical protein
LAKLIRRVVDPNAQELTGLPETHRDLMTAGVYAHVLVLDNLSWLADDWSDMLIKRSEGVTAAYRTKFSNNELTIVISDGPTVLTSIDSLVGRADLARRCLFLHLDSKALGAGILTREESDRRIEQLATGILHTLLSGSVMGLDRMSSMRSGSGFSLADFAVFSQAAAPAFGWTAEQVATVLQDHVRVQRQVVAANDPVLEALSVWFVRHSRKEGGKLLGDSATWQGATAQLLGHLNDTVLSARFAPDWPKTTAQLGRHLRRQERILRELGLEIVWHRARSAAAGFNGVAHWLTICFMGQAHEPSQVPIADMDPDTQAGERAGDRLH